MDIEIYTTKICAYCVRAKSLLKNIGLGFTEIDVSTDTDKAIEIAERSGQRTVPQIFIDGRSIGGFTELAELNAAGELNQTQE